MTRDPDDIREPSQRHTDFLGVFAMHETAAGILFVQNRRVIGGRDTLVWDLPGGQLEPGESLREALCRELREEIGVEVDGEPEFLFFQEGERVVGGVRRYVWRSFFFRVARWRGTPIAQNEVLAVQRLRRADLPALLTAPYHDSFLAWLAAGGTSSWSQWRDP